MTPFEWRVLRKTGIMMAVLLSVILPLAYCDGREKKAEIDACEVRGGVLIGGRDHPAQCVSKDVLR